MISELIDQIIYRGLEGDERVAIRDSSGSSFTYRELAESVRSVTGGLIDAGMQIGDPVLLASKQSIETLVLAMSIVRAGGMLVPFSPYGGEALAQARLAALRPKWVVANSTTLLASRIQLVRMLLRRKGLTLPDLTNIQDCRWVHVGKRWPGTPQGLTYSELLKFSGQKELPDIPKDTASVAVFTSGTTSDPKAVVHTNTSSGESVRISAKLLKLDQSDTVFASALHALLPTLHSGATGYVGLRADQMGQNWITSIRESGASVLFTTPSQLQSGVNHIRQNGQQLSDSIKKIVIGSAPVHPALLTDLRAVVDQEVQVVSVYAMTEILPVALVTAEHKLEFEQEGDLVGKAVDQINMRVGDDGELFVSGPHLFDRYLNGRPVREHNTGDLARILPSGDLVLLGRKKDMIIRRAENIYPSLYEPTINSIPGVQRCALVGVSDDGSRDESVVLAIQPDVGEEAEIVRKRVLREIASGPYSIDKLAHPDLIVSMPIPLSGRSLKIDRIALRRGLEKVR